MHFAFTIILLGFNAWVFSYSSKPGLAYLRIVFWLGAPVIAVALGLLSRQHVRTGVLLLAMLLCVALRLLDGPVLMNSTCATTIHAVVLTEPNSQRGNFVPEWVNEYTSFELKVDTNTPQMGHYRRELAYVDDCKHALENQLFTTYAYRIFNLLETTTFNGEDDWLLLLENDAEPMHPNTFQSNVERLTCQGEYDLIWLDYRNVFSDWNKEYTGTAGVMVRGTALRRAAEALKYHAGNCHQFEWPMSPDNTWGTACARGELSCFTKVLVFEHGFVSTLGWKREERYGTLQVSWTEYLVSNLLVVVVLLCVCVK